MTSPRPSQPSSSHSKEFDKPQGHSKSTSLRTSTHRTQTKSGSTKTDFQPCGLGKTVFENRRSATNTKFPPLRVKAADRNYSLDIMPITRSAKMKHRAEKTSSEMVHTMPMGPSRERSRARWRKLPSELPTNSKRAIEPYYESLRKGHSTRCLTMFDAPLSAELHIHFSLRGSSYHPSSATTRTNQISKKPRLRS